MKGHVFMFIGNYEGKNFVINSLGNIGSKDVPGEIKRVYSVSVVPLSTPRKNGNMFFHDLNCAVVYDNGYSL